MSEIVRKRKYKIEGIKWYEKPIHWVYILVTIKKTVNISSLDVQNKVVSSASCDILML
jgi:hypothetical protein